MKDEEKTKAQLIAELADLRNTEKKYRTIVASVSDIVFLIDEDDSFLDVHYRNDTNLYQGLEKFIGKRHQEVMPPDVTKTYQKAAETVRETGESQTYEYSLQMGEKTKWYEATLNRYGDERNLVAGITDITERVLAEEQVTRTLALVEAILDSTDNGILVIGDNRKVVKANATFAKLWCIPDDVMGSGDSVQLLNFVVDQFQDPDQFIDRVNELYDNPEMETSDTLWFNSLSDLARLCIVE